MSGYKFRLSLKKKERRVNLVKERWFMRQPKYTPLPKLIAKLDRIFSQYKRLSNLTPQGYIRCFTCGKFCSFRETDCGHYIGRENMNTRYLDENTEPQCHYCNRFAEGRKDEFAINLQRKYGSRILDILNQKKHEFKQFTSIELEGMITCYKQRVNDLKSRKGYCQ